MRFDNYLNNFFSFVHFSREEEENQNFLRNKLIN